MLVQGIAGGPFEAQPTATGSLPPAVLATGYLGDVAVALPTGDDRIALSLERFYARDLKAVASLPGATGPAADLTVTMDYRSDVLLVWAQRNAVYAQAIDNRDVPGRLQRLGPAGSGTQIAALLSDDDRGMVLWSARRDGVTSVYLDYSAQGPRFGRPRLVERFTDPPVSETQPGRVRLVRLSSEGVLAAWSTVIGGHVALHLAPIDEHGMRMVATIASPQGGVTLEALAAGPYEEAFVLFSEPLPGQRATEQAMRALIAERALDVAPGITLLSAPEVVASPTRLEAATLAVDPDSGRAVAAWWRPAGVVSYAVRAASGGG
jgi:hypothetical protein